MTEHSLCFGIDFGTTYSGVSWAWSGKPGQIHAVTKWPSRSHQNSDLEKTPTAFAISYSADGDEVVTWGYDIPEGAQPFRLFKLFLVEQDQLPEHLKTWGELNEARERLKSAKLDPVDAVAKYLKALWAHAIKQIRNTLGPTDAYRYHISLTVPAIWRDAARQKMRDAAGKAGLLERREAGSTTLTLISEPEAGAISTLFSMEGRPDIAQGDSILIVDAGGGTVDLISYTVDCLDPFTLSECVEGSGGLCGAVFLDRSFKLFLRKRLTASVWDNIPPQKLTNFLNREWERGIKQEFDGTEERSYIIDLPSSCRAVIEDCELELEHGHLVDIFGHVVEDIEPLVWKQLEAVNSRMGSPAKYVILVGGFGRSGYLATSLRHLVGPRKTRVLQGTGSTPWTAICRGAVLYGLMTKGGLESTVQISSRISRAHYGTTVNEHFKEGVHKEEDKYWDSYDGSYMAVDQMDWYVLRGDKISTLEPVVRKYCQRYDCSRLRLTKQPEFELTLYTSTEEPAPSRFYRSTSIQKLCSLTSTYPVAFDDLPIEKSSTGKRSFQRIHFQVKVTADGSAANFEVYENSKDGIPLSDATLLSTKWVEVDCDSDLGGRLARLQLKC